jgi:hypothetical protein
MKPGRGGDALLARRTFTARPSEGFPDENVDAPWGGALLSQPVPTE